MINMFESHKVDDAVARLRVLLCDDETEIRFAERRLIERRSALERQASHNDEAAKALHLFDDADRPMRKFRAATSPNRLAALVDLVETQLLKTQGGDGLEDKYVANVTNGAPPCEVLLYLGAVASLICQGHSMPSLRRPSTFKRRLAGIRPDGGYGPLLGNLINCFGNAAQDLSVLMNKNLPHNTLLREDFNMRHYGRATPVFA